MKQIFFIVLLLAACAQPKQDCADFRMGKFISTIRVKGVDRQTVSVRMDSLVIETYNGRTDTASVRWVNDCEYVLRKLRPKTMAEKQAVDIKILSTSGKNYTFEFGIVGSPERKRGTATRIE